MKGSLKMTKEALFYEAVNGVIIDKVRGSLGEISRTINPQILIILSLALRNSPTSQSLLSGKLKDDFGLFGNVAETAITNIIDFIASGSKVKVDVSKTSKSLLSVSIVLPTGDIGSIVNVPGGSYPSKGGEVKWLEWLLTKGTEVVISNFWLYPYAKGFTRSGGSSIMIKLVNQGEPFRVDPDHAGTPDDNFLTRAIEPYADRILTVAIDAIGRRLK